MKYKQKNLRNKIGTLLILQTPSASQQTLRTGTISSQDATTGYLLEWNVTYGTTGMDLGNGLTVDDDGYIYLVGDLYDAANANNDAFIAKYNWTGELLLEIAYDFVSRDEHGYGVAVNSTGFIFLTGSTSDGSLSGTTQDQILMQYDPQGVEQSPSWHYGSSSGDDTGYDVIVDANDYVYVTGAIYSTGKGDQLNLRKYTPGLTQLWTKFLGDSGTEEGYGIAVDSSGDVYVAGRTSSWGAGGYDALIAKYSSSGTKLWNVTWGMSGDSTGRDIVLDASNCLVVGTTPWNLGTTLLDMHLSRFSRTTGATLGWSYWRGDSNDWGYGIAKDTIGNFYLCGSTKVSGTWDAVVVKYDSSYALQWNLTWGVPGTYDVSREIALDSRDNIYLAGTTQSYGAGSSDAYLAKFGPDPDLDGLTNDQENYIYGTNPNDADHDNDGYSDGEEVAAGTDPLDPSDHPSDIPAFQFGYILLALLMVLGVLMSLTKSKDGNLKTL
ncbi:MAG: SBBP repeat-containing protein [Candidatus Helarchaeota archaeon]